VGRAVSFAVPPSSIGTGWQKNVGQANRKSEDPSSIGEALKGSKLGDFWKYRVADYRIIVAIQDKVLRIYVVEIGDRKEVYR
jgi:mRNA-degrading endonuclease RelE of RelBE toxin-antitoxin system